MKAVPGKTVTQRERRRIAQMAYMSITRGFQGGSLEEIVAYYRAIVNHDQYYMLEQDNDVVAFCEFWKIKEQDIPRIKDFHRETLYPHGLNIFQEDGNVAYIAMFISEQSHDSLDLLMHFKRLIRKLKVKKVCWHKDNTKEFSEFYVRGDDNVEPKEAED